MASTVCEWNLGGNLIKGTIHGLNSESLNRGCLTERTASGTFTAIPNSNYNVSGFFTTMNVPAGQPVGTRLKLVAPSAIATLQFDALNYVTFSGVSSTLGGTLVSRQNGATVEIECTGSFGQTQWTIINFTGQWEISRSPDPYIIDQIGNQIQPLVKQFFQRDKNTPITLDIQNGILKDTVGLNSINFENRQLISPDGSHVQIDYSVDQVINLSPQGAPLDNLVKINKLSVFSGVGAPIGTATLVSGSILVTVDGASVGDIVLVSHANLSNTGVLKASVILSNTVNIQSTNAGDTTVNYWVIKKH